MTITLPPLPAPVAEMYDLEALRSADEEHRRAQAAIYDALQPESPDRDTWPDEIRRLRAAQPSAEPTTECTTCGATVVRVTGVYDYPPPSDESGEIVQAAIAALEADCDWNVRQRAADGLRALLERTDAVGDQR